MHALASPQILHAAVTGSFPMSASQHDGRILWRIDALGNSTYLLVSSPGKPDFTHIVEQFGWPGSEQTWESKDYDALLNRLHDGQNWNFRLRANPAHREKASVPGETGKLFAHVTVRQQEQWLMERAAQYGFHVGEGSFAVMHREIKKFWREKKQVTLGIATFEGTLEVVDKALFTHTLLNGIGRAKAYGCGLLTIMRI